MSHIQTEMNRGNYRFQNKRLSDIISSYISNTKVSQENISTIDFHVINYTRRNIQWNLEAVGVRYVRKKTIAGVSAKHIKHNGLE